MSGQKIRDAIGWHFSRPDRDEWTDSDAAEVFAAALLGLLDQCDREDTFHDPAKRYLHTQEIRHLLGIGLVPSEATR